MLLKPAIQSAGFHPGGGGGEASPPPPQKERENEEKRKRRERERKRGAWCGKGESVHFCIALQVISILLLHDSII